MMAPPPSLLRGSVVVLSDPGSEAEQVLRAAGLDVTTGSEAEITLPQDTGAVEVVILIGRFATPARAHEVRAHPRLGLARLVLVLERDAPRDADALADVADALLEAPVSAPVLLATVTRQFREQEREIAADERHLRAVVEAAPLALWMLNSQGEATFANRPLLRFMGQDSLEPGAGLWAGRVHPDDAPARTETVQRAIGQRLPYQVEYRLRRADGEYRTVTETGLPRSSERRGFTGYIGAFLDVTDQRQAQELMRVRAQFNRGTFDNSPESITLIDLEGVIRTVNPAGLRALRLTDQNQLVGRPWVTFWSGAEREEAEQALARARRGRVARFRGYAPTARGEPRWWDVILSPMYESGRAPDQIVALARDITDVKRAEAESRRLLNEQSALLESTGEGIYGVDLEGRCTFINSSALAELGYEQDEVLGQDTHVLIHHHDASGNAGDANDCLITRTLRERRAFKADNDVLQRKDGSVAPVEYSVHPIIVDDQITGAVVSFRNISERLRAEEERERLLAAEQAARIAAENAVSVRNAVLATVSHDLKNPITAIKGTAQLLTRMAQRVNAPEAEQIVEGLQHIDATTSRMVSLINELVDVARLRAGQPLELRRRGLDLRELVTPIIDSIRAATDQHAIDVAVEGEDFSGYWDGERLERVVSNLLSNAVKYSPDGGRIACRLTRLADAVQFAVQDSGVGIPADDLPHVFRPFHRAANVREQFAGTGLGLAGARHIITAHGGGIVVESTVGAGTTITFRLPIALPDLDDEETRREEG